MSQGFKNNLRGTKNYFLWISMKALFAYRVVFIHASSRLCHTMECVEGMAVKSDNEGEGMRRKQFQSM